ncbi:MAG: hypothetical protein COA78_17745, partial [Blastopirellula sp.]
LDGEPIAAECTYINPEKLMCWCNSKQPKQNVLCNAVFALEPHHWVKKSVEDKEPKIPKYLDRTKAKEVWLILHSIVDEPFEWYPCDEQMLETMNRAARAIQPKFDQIWFLHNECEVVAKRIWVKGEPEAEFPDVIKDGKYPSFKISKVNVSQHQDESLLQITETEERPPFPPIDSRYTIEDYRLNNAEPNK